MGGFFDDTVVSTQVVTQKILQKAGDFHKVINIIALAHQQDPNGRVISQYTEQAQGIKAKFNGYYLKGKESANGLPSTNMRSMAINQEAVKAALIVEYGISDITVDTAVEGIPDKYEWVASQLRASHNYIASSKTLEISGSVYTVSSIEYNHTTANYDISASYYTGATTILSIPANIPYPPTVVNTPSPPTVVNTPFPPTSSNTPSPPTVVNIPYQYIVAKYHIGANSATWYYWVYRMGSGVYPTVDTSNVPAGTIELMPIIPLRSNFVNTSKDKTPTTYKESVQLSKIFGIDLDNMISSINSNPDIKEVSDAFLHLSVDLAENAPLVNKIVYETFVQLYADSGLFNKHISEFTTYVTEGAFNNALYWDLQSKTITQGSIGAVGTYGKSIVTSQRKDKDSKSDSPSYYNVYDLVMTKQVTEEYYITLTMGNMVQSTNIDKKGHRSSSSRSLKGGIQMSIGFLLLDSLDLREQVEVLPYILKVSVYAIKITHLEWYQTRGFRIFLEILSFIIFFATLGTGAPLVTVLTYLAISLAVGYAVGYAIKKLLESDAPDWVKVLGVIILVAVGIYFGMSAGSGEFLTAAQLSVAVTQSAYTIIGTASAITAGLANAVTVYTQIQLNNLEDADSKFHSNVDLRQEVIDDAYDNLVQGLDVTDIEWLLNRDIPEAYIKGVDAFMYRAKGGIQYEYSALYSYETRKDYYISAMLNVGIL